MGSKGNRISRQKKWEFLMSFSYLSANFFTFNIGRRQFLKAARQYLDYSPKTNDIDIITSLLKVWKEAR